MTQIGSLEGGLIVSCQAARDTPLSRPDVLGLIAATVVEAGAVAVRAEGVPNIEAIRAAVGVPLIGLWKDGSDGPYITPTLDHALAVAAAGADIIAIDGTDRPRRDGRALADVVRAIHEQTRCLVLADISTFDEGIAAAAFGADMVATTLAGYTTYSRPTDGPDIDLVLGLSSSLAIPVLAEGRIRTPAQAKAAIDAGAWAVVVGTAITDPAAITSAFRQELRLARGTPSL